MAIRGLWSSVRMRLFKPSTKNLHLSRPWIAASASPSMGWYRDSAGEQNLLPQKTVCHPVGQQPGIGWESVLHLQCFCVNQNPRPSLAQSVARAVGRSGLKLRTPFSHCRMTSCLEASNAVSSSAVQWNGTLDDNRCLKGAMIGAEANEKDIWLMAPYHDLMSVMVFGVGKCRIESVNSWVGLTPSSVTKNPRKLTSLSPN